MNSVFVRREKSLDSAIGCEWAYCEDPAKVNGIVSLYLEGIYIALFIKTF